ncbi:transposase family protein [Streptomyces sp. NPDC049910]|uniref:transposase family protein n=1 Tax=Streptomyces sp. NPDC049910 TaxID=3155278 RepID=UPI00344236E5
MIWISAARPGRIHDNTAARHDHIPAHLRASGLGALPDLGCRGLENDILDPVIVTGYTATRTHKLIPGQKEANRVLAVGGAPVEHGFDHLKNWRTLTILRIDPARATRLLRAARPDEPRNQPLTDILLRRLTPTTSTSTPRTGHTSPLTCDFKLAAAQCAAWRQRCDERLPTLRAASAVKSGE